ncbi:MAG TPA: formylglycine-generating enzyme family protein [Candidatus Krumholzibacteria bacterium]|nr:formylglycine-generating enzyme family protein [Candidatus Krumholzibacteria bacterium]
MRPVFILLSIPAILAGTLVASATQNAPRTDAHVVAPRPDPIPPVQDMVFVPAGDFLMGSTAEEVQRSADVDEFPQRHVWVDDFFIDVHEVTNAQYKVYLDATHAEAPPKWVNGNYGIGEDGLPVISITWDEAAAYARFMGKRLPTEAEWEKAARGTDGRQYPWGQDFERTYANNGDHLMPIMSYPLGVSPYGAYDMAGNAAEWVDGWYQSYPRGPNDILPKNVPDRRDVFKDDRRVYRGGSWNTFPKYLRCANRENASPGKRWVYIGFRCAMDPPWKTKPAPPQSQ